MKLNTAYIFIVLFFSAHTMAIDNPDAVDYVTPFKKSERIYLDKIDNATGYADPTGLYTEYLAFLDEQLNIIYKVLMTELPDEKKALLKASQIKWITYRDSEFSFIDETWTRGDYGTSAAVSRGAYKSALMRSRVIKLMHYSLAI